MLLIITCMAPSSIEELGVFADEFVPKGSLIWSLDPKFDIFVNEAEISALPPHMRAYLARYTTRILSCRAVESSMSITESS